MERFAELLGRRGVGDGVTVICYDDQGGQMAARLWWLLRYAGHDEAAVLDGGYGAWRAAGGPVSAEVPAPAPRRFVLRLRPHMAVGMEDVRRIVDGGRDHGLIVDSHGAGALPGRGGAAGSGGRPHPRRPQLAVDGKSGPAGLFPRARRAGEKIRGVAGRYGERRCSTAGRACPRA